MNNDILSPLHCWLSNHLLHHHTNPSVIQPHCESLKKVNLVCPVLVACLCYPTFSIRGFFTYATCWITVVEKVPSPCLFRFSVSVQRERKRNDKKQRMRQATFVSTHSPAGGANVIMGRTSRGMPVLCQDDCYVSLKQEKERHQWQQKQNIVSLMFLFYSVVADLSYFADSMKVWVWLEATLGDCKEKGPCHV